MEHRWENVQLREGSNCRWSFSGGKTLDFREEWLEVPNRLLEQPTSSRDMISQITQLVQKLNLSIAHFSYWSLSEKISLYHLQSSWLLHVLTRPTTLQSLHLPMIYIAFLSWIAFINTQVTSDKIFQGPNSGFQTRRHSSNNPVLITLLR